MNKNQKNKSNSKEAKNMRKAKGFTLIELIAVIAILGILAVVLVPNIIGYTNKAKISKAQSDAGIIIRAIDAYEAGTTETLTTAVITPATETMTLVAVATLDKTASNNIGGKSEIFGQNAPIKSMPKEFTSDGVGSATSTVSKVTIADLRLIASRELDITVQNNHGGRVIVTDISKYADDNANY